MEVVIFFDKFYLYEEVCKMLLSNVNLVWFYVYFEMVNEVEGFFGMLFYGF